MAEVIVTPLIIQNPALWALAQNNCALSESFVSSDVGEGSATDYAEIIIPLGSNVPYVIDFTLLKPRFTNYPAITYERLTLQSGVWVIVPPLETGRIVDNNGNLTALQVYGDFTDSYKLVFKI